MEASEVTQSTTEGESFTNPTYTWECEVFGCGSTIIVQKEDGKQPNIFWRQMQYLIFGNKWKRIR